ncbi:MAG TPA: hypothetical protein VFO10_15395 [Oligoflexus sp.]|uniref:hypothetical protein n=1 Tax=Oligoflexus sp. TaxID=1971216 RepID=UPI002D7F3EB9|nr:hypothetical protein [Oligoflexus sp.]HET9238645.1 hypothetical protein [Oligoflexus sp.]
MLKFFLADIKQLKKPIIFLILTIPLLHYLDRMLFHVALPSAVHTIHENSVVSFNDPFAAYSGWIFALFTSVILLLVSVEASGGSQSRLPTLLSLPLSRWQVALLRHLPSLIVVPLLGLLLNFYRMMLNFFRGMGQTDLWMQTGTMDWATAKACLIWAFESVTSIYGSSYMSVVYQWAGWTSMSLLILGIPLLIDDLWPHIKRSSLALWISISLFAGLALQTLVFSLSKALDLNLLPPEVWPAELMPRIPAWQPSLITIELTLALMVLGLELWRFQRRSSYV